MVKRLRIDLPNSCLEGPKDGFCLIPFRALSIYLPFRRVSLDTYNPGSIGFSLAIIYYSSRLILFCSYYL